MFIFFVVACFSWAVQLAFAVIWQSISTVRNMLARSSSLKSITKESNAATSKAADSSRRIIPLSVEPRR